MNSYVFTGILGLLLLQTIVTVESRPLTEELIEGELSHRLKRSTDVLQTFHDYELGVFLNRGKWRKEKCNYTYDNCDQVATEHCTATYTRFVSPDNNGKSLCLNMSPIHTCQ